MRPILLIIILVSITSTISLGQETIVKYKTKFVPEHVTYNASPDPSQCWEAVDSGIRIKTKEGDSFFLIPVKEVESLKDKIKDTEVWVEVSHYSPDEQMSSGSGARGWVISISMENDVIYRNQQR